MAQQQQKAKTVYDVEYVTLQGGTVIEVKDLPIKKLRYSQKLINDALSGHPEVDDDGNEVVDDAGEPKITVDEDEVFDAFVTVVELVMQDKSNVDKCGEFLDPDSGRELLEDTLDQKTLFEIVRLATGYDFLKIQQAAEQMMQRAGVTL